MSKPLSSFPEGQRKAVAKRRVASKTGGLGYLSALAYLARAEKPKPDKAKAKED